MPILIGVFGSFTAIFGLADTAFVFGGSSGAVVYNTVENYQFATPGTKGTAPTTLSSLRYNLASAGCATTALILGGSTNDYPQSLATGEKYNFADGTKGSAPSNLSAGVMNFCGAGNDTTMFVFGGGNTSSATVTTVESYTFATGTKNSAPAALSSGRVGTSAGSNLYNAFVFGGYTNTANSTGTTVSTVENYQFNVPGTKGTTPASLVDTKHSTAAGANGTNCFVFGGENTSGSDLSSCDNYIFATPGTKGTSPAATATLNRLGSSAANQTNAFLFGGYNATGGVRLTTVENYIFATPSSKGTAAAALAAINTGSTAASNRSTRFLLVPDQNYQGTDVAFVLGGYTTTATSTCEQYIFATGLKGTNPADLSSARYAIGTAANTTNMFTFAGYNDISGTGSTTCENYIFATPGTKGTAPAATATAGLYTTTAASNLTVAFVFGGWSTTTAHAVSAAEQYIFATPGSKGTAPSSLSSAREGLIASGNASVAFVFGGWEESSGLPVTTIEQYIFATPGSKGSNPIALATARYGPASAGNATLAFVFGGTPTSSVTGNVATCEQYIYATPGSRGSAPTNLGTALFSPMAASNSTNAFTFGGLTTSTTSISTVENYIFSSATKGSAPAVLSVVRENVGAAGNNRGI